MPSRSEIYGCTTPPCDADIDFDGVTGLSDLALLLADYGEPCGG